VALVNAQPSAIPAHLGLMQILNGGAVASAVVCLAKLGIPDLVESGPKSAEELARQIGAQPRALYRLMRATASVGVLAEGPDSRFSQTPLSDVLRTKANPSLRAWALFGTQEWYLRGWERLEYSVRTGKPPLEEVYGKSLFEHFKESPAEAQVFNDGMTALSTIDSPAVADAYSFDGIRSIVDVAGGHGLLLATILARNPQMTGTLFDEPHVIEGAKSGPLKSVLDRCTLVPGNMFVSLPAGADAYIMKHILHDWQDDVCIKLLKSCRAAVNPGGKLLVVDCVIPPGNSFHPGKFIDLAMMLFPGGRERTEKEFAELFAAAGWRLNRVVPTAAAESAVEGVPV
jgi:hypothetical protein